MPPPLPPAIQRPSQQWMRCNPTSAIASTSSNSCRIHRETITIICRSIIICSFLPMPITSSNFRSSHPHRRYNSSFRVHSTHCSSNRLSPKLAWPRQLRFRPSNGNNSWRRCSFKPSSSKLSYRGHPSRLRSHSRIFNHFHWWANLRILSLKEVEWRWRRSHHNILLILPELRLACRRH